MYKAWNLLQWTAYPFWYKILEMIEEHSFHKAQKQWTSLTERQFDWSVSDLHSNKKVGKAMKGNLRNQLGRWLQRKPLLSSYLWTSLGYRDLKHVWKICKTQNIAPHTLSAILQELLGNPSTHESWRVHVSVKVNNTVKKLINLIRYIISFQWFMRTWNWRTWQDFQSPENQGLPSQ